MTNRKPNRPTSISNRLFGSSRTFTLCCFVYFLGGYTLIKEYWPDSDMAFYFLVAVGTAAVVVFLKR